MYDHATYTWECLLVNLRKIRANFPLILCIGYSNRMSEDLARHIGSNAITLKPFTKVDLSKTIRAVLALRKTTLSTS